MSRSTSDLQALPFIPNTFYLAKLLRVADPRSIRIPEESKYVLNKSRRCVSMGHGFIESETDSAHKQFGWVQGD
jgi:hypothetical protein